MNKGQVIDLSLFYWSHEAVEVISRNSGHRISPAYLRRLITYRLLSPIKLNGHNLYPKEQVDGIVVRESRRGEDKVA